MIIKQDLPTNEHNLTATQTVEAVREQSRQFTQQEADYRQDEGDEGKSCGLCFFWQGGGQCQVVGGEINQSGLSDLYINKEQQDAAIGQGGEDMSKGNGKRETKAFSVGEFKIIDADQGIVEHLVAVTGNVDQGDDIIHPGAFTKTSAERGHKVKVVDSHNYDSAMDAIGVPLRLWEVSRDELPPEVLAEFPSATGGLMARTQFLMDTDKGAGIFKRIKAGAIDQYSIGYDALDSDMSKVLVDGRDRTVRNLRTIKLYEYSPVVFAMNEATGTVSAKSKALNLSRQIEDVRSAFHSQYNTPNCYDYWVNTVYDEFIIVTHEGPEGVQHFQVSYVHNDEKVVFAPRAEWTEGDYEFAAKSREAKAGRMLSAANAERISSALITLMDVLERAGIDIPGFDTSAAHEDDDEEKIKSIIYNLTINDDSTADNLKKFVELLAAQGVTKSPYAPLLPSRDVFTRFKELVDDGMDRPGAYFEAVLEQAELATKDPPAPARAADNEHQAGPRDAPTSDSDVLIDIELLQAELSLMEV